VVGATYPLERAPDALDDIMIRSVRGKIVLAAN